MSREFAVVGAGLAGAATAWRLAQRGERVTVLERAAPANRQGSSHGSARIFRYAYPDPFYANLAAEARDHWDELSQAADVPLIRYVGALDFGTRRDPAHLAGVLTSIGVENELLTASQAARRWPGMHIDGPVLWQPGAGVLDAESSVNAMIALARSAGAAVREDWTVTRLVPDGARVSIRSAHGDELTVDHVVVAAGGWLPSLAADLPFQLPPLHVSKEQAFHFPYRDPVADWPTTVHKQADIATYSLPGGRDAGHRGHKVAEYLGGTGIPSAAGNDGIVDPDNRRRVVEYVEKYLPGLVPEPYAETTCVFTMTPTEDFVIDTAGPFTVASPCSGHGAKFAPLLGALIADSALGVAPAADRFRVPRRG
ncbi:FAD-dependent oxidoreductase [Actinoplanes sp. NPDC026670]|uniref:FAD-dependent oxidoreductase n=1 Tax=Actinoplanes sp. NPDC026670 TaxID=3154700 RepID=UPI00340E5285